MKEYGRVGYDYTVPVEENLCQILFDSDARVARVHMHGVRLRTVPGTRYTVHVLVLVGIATMVHTFVWIPIRTD